MSGVKNVLGVLIDLSGTIHVENTAVPGAIEAIRTLRSLPGVELKFVTNTTKESGRTLHERLLKIGFKIERSEIFTSLIAARDLVKQRNIRPMLLLEGSAKEDFEGISTDNPNAVVIGLAPSQFNYPTLNDAFRLIQNGPTLIGIHKARYFKQTEGLSLGPGPFVTALEYATDCKAITVGKPEAAFFNAAIESMSSGEELLRTKNVIMIGDDARDDIGGAQNAGFRGILVKTGKYRPNDESKIENGPWKLADSFADCIDIIEGSSS